MPSSSMTGQVQPTGLHKLPIYTVNDGSNMVCKTPHTLFLDDFFLALPCRLAISELLFNFDLIMQRIGQQFSYSRKRVCSISI